MNGIRKFLILIASFMLFQCTGCGKPELLVVIRSPDGSIQVLFELDEGTPVYSVSYGDRIVLDASRLGLEMKKSNLLTGMEIVGSERCRFDETYDIVVGKSKQARNRGNEIRVDLRRIADPHKRLSIVFRAYDDGVAFRYLIPKTSFFQDLEINQERSEFNFTANPTCWALLLDGFTTNYERPFIEILLSEITPDTLVGLPMTLQLADDIYCAITEAALTDYAGMYLKRTGQMDSGLISVLSPLPDGTESCVRASAPHVSPWRVVMFGKRPGDLLESNLVTHLNEPCAIEDVSWIRPGKVAWPWWSDRVVTGVEFEGGMNTATMLHYADFAAEYGLEYLLIDAKWYGPHKDASQDITTTIPEVDLPKIITYATERNVDVLLWLNWENTRDQMDVAFPLYEKWGIKGVKIDYMNRDDQEVVRFYHDVTRKAAEHRLMVDFHGSYKPTGIRRTYPNLMTREGILGLEHTKWSARVTPEHNVTIPFTRMLAGPMDYTPGGFRNVAPDQFKAQYRAPMAMGTRCHHLAMYVVYESPLQMCCDYPGAYRGEQSADFLRVVPASWDDTNVIDGQIGDYIAVARKHGEDWFLGAMTDEEPRSLALPVDFLNEGVYEATVYADGKDAVFNPTSVVVSHVDVTVSDTLIADMASGGGYVVHLHRMEN